MPGKQNINVIRVTTCIQELKNLVTTLPVTTQGNPLDPLNYYSRLYVIAMVGELAGLARRLDGSLENEPILKKLVENRNKLFHSKAGKSSWLSPDIVLLSQDVPTAAQLDAILLIFTDAKPTASSSFKDRKVEIPSTKKRDLAVQKQQEPVADEITCMAIFWQTITACEMLSQLQYSGNLSQDRLIHAAQTGSCMHLANFFVYGLGETDIVIKYLNPIPSSLSPSLEAADILLEDGHQHHGNLAHSITSPIKSVEFSKEALRNGAHAFYVWWQAHDYLKRISADSSPFDGSNTRETWLQETIQRLALYRGNEITDIVIFILKGEIDAIQQARDEIQKLLETINPEERLLSLTQLLKYENATNHPNFTKLVLLQQEITKLEGMPQASQEQATLDSEEPDTKKRKGLEKPTSQVPSGADLDSHSPLVGDDLALELAKKESLLAAQKQGKVGPREIPGWVLYDVEDKGNCFYDSAVHQMQSIQPFQQFLTSIHDTTTPRDSLRLRIQGREFKDREWADQPEIEKLARCFNAIVAIVDTRGDAHNFVYHYIGDGDNYDYTTDRTLLPPDRSIIKLAFTGNHYMSVVSHPSFDLQHAHTPEEARQQKQAIAAEESSKPTAGFQGRLSGLADVLSTISVVDVKQEHLPQQHMTPLADYIDSTSLRVADRVNKEHSNPVDKAKPKPLGPTSPSSK